MTNLRKLGLLLAAFLVAGVALAGCATPEETGGDDGLGDGNDTTGDQNDTGDGEFVPPDEGDVTNETIYGGEGSPDPDNREPGVGNESADESGPAGDDAAPPS